MEGENVVHQSILEFLYIFFLPLASDKLLPGGEQIFDRNDIFVSMSELDPLGRTPPRRNLLPVIEHTKKLYTLWIPIRRNIARTERFGIGNRIDTLLLELLELLRTTAFMPASAKIPLLEKALQKVDSLRFFLQLAWESSVIKQNQYLQLAPTVEEIGKMVGGWRKGLLAKTPPSKDG